MKADLQIMMQSAGRPVRGSFFSRLQVTVIRKLHLRLKVAILFGSNIVWSDKKVSAAFDCLFPELRIIQIETTRNGFCKNSESLTSKSRDPSSIHNL